MKRPAVVELNADGNAVRRATTSAEAELSVVDHLPLVYKAEASYLDSVDRIFVRKRSPSSPKMMVGNQKKR